MPIRFLQTHFTNHSQNQLPPLHSALAAVVMSMEISGEISRSARHRRRSRAHPLRNQRYATKHNIPDANRFNTWEDVFKRPKFADAIIITTPDNLHYGPCMKALEMGYDILLEKPIAPTEKECRDILSMAKNPVASLPYAMCFATHLIS